MRALALIVLVIVLIVSATLMLAAIGYSDDIPADESPALPQSIQDLRDNGSTWNYDPCGNFPAVYGNDC